MSQNNSDKNKTKIDDEQCAMITSRAIGDILRISNNKEFRKSCYKIMKVTDTVECQTKINDKLLELSQKTALFKRQLEVEYGRVTDHCGEIIERKKSRA